MKNLKFRAWLKEDKEMISVDELAFNTKWVRGFYKLASRWFKLEQVELMSSTGLFDKKGVEIFEGDILADLDKSGDELVYLYVIYKDGKFMAVENEEHGYSADLIDCTTYHSVVGNIYENAELLNNNDDTKKNLEEYPPVTELEIQAEYDGSQWYIDTDNEETVEKMNDFLRERDSDVFEGWLAYLDGGMSIELFGFITLLRTIENGVINLYDGSKIKLVEG